MGENFLGQVIITLLTVFLGGGAVMFYNARTERRKLDAEAQKAQREGEKIHATTEAEVESLVVATTSAAMESVRQQLDEVRAENAKLKEDRQADRVVIAELTGWMRGVVEGFNVGTVPPFPPLSERVPDHVLWHLPPTIRTGRATKTNGHGVNNPPTDPTTPTGGRDGT